MAGGSVDFSLSPKYIRCCLQEILSHSQTANQTPVNIFHVVPRTLTNFGRAIQKGFDDISRRGVSGFSTLAIDSKETPEAFAGKVKRDLVCCDVLLLEVHGAEQEVRIMEAILAQPFQAKIIMLIHRPEELVLRMKHELDSPSASLADAAEALREKCARVDSIVVLGDSGIARFQEIFPDKIVTAIFHPYFSSPVSSLPNEESSQWRYRPDAVVVIGSNTTWGEMRDIEDVVSLLVALRGQVRAVGYVAGNFQRQHVPMEDLIARSQSAEGSEGGCVGVRFLCNDEILSAYREGKFRDEETFREWLYVISGMGKQLIIRATLSDDDSSFQSNSLSNTSTTTTVDVGECDGTSVKEWEDRLVDFNLQLYKENLAHLREPVQTMCAPYSLAKEEYSGTLHKGASLSHEIFLVLDSVAMTDVAEAEGLKMLHVSVCKRSQAPLAEEGADVVRAAVDRVEPNYDDTVREIVRLVRSCPEDRIAMMRHNVEVARVNNVGAAAFGYVMLARHLIIASNHSL